ncbi:APC family permease [Terrimonas sp.]|uniref:APC family permease n=1 Tax=Terrimonas sp. TaxID=1914338 RepID=UPI001403F0F4|nr:APC family permease [Terrimonas sp.]
MASSGKTLGFFSLTMIVVSLVVGMGIFGTPAKVAATSGSSIIFFSVWLTGGLVALCGALTYAEIGVRLPVMGGYYKIFAECYHPAVGFTVNALILISNAASLGVVALIGADYVSDLLFGKPSGQGFTVAVSIIAVCLFYTVNLMGLQTSSRMQNILTVVKTAVMILLIASVLKGIMVEPHGYNENSSVYKIEDHGWLKLYMISLVPVFFSYGGYQQTINFGSEVQQTSIFPKAIISGIFISILLYVGINFAYTQVIGYERMKNASAIGALLCEAWFGKTGAKVFDGLMFLSVLAYVNVSLMSNPRVMYAMSQDQVLPAFFSKRNSKTLALTGGLTVFAIITIIITFFGKEVDNILGFSIFLDSIGMSTSAATLFILRKRRKNEEAVSGGWTKWTPLLAAIFVLAYAGVAVAVIIDKPLAALTGVILLLLLTIVYFIFYHRKKA